jgi:neutral ceramidase
MTGLDLGAAKPKRSQCNHTTRNGKAISLLFRSMIDPDTPHADNHTVRTIKQRKTSKRMTALLAGFAKTDISPKVGCQMVGYAGRPSGATGVHDPLHARAMVLENEQGTWALITADLCYLNAESVAEIRAAVQQRVGITPQRLFVATTHTHAGPHDRHPENWDRPLAELISDAVEQAHQARRPARLGSGYGFLYGYSINRRWLDRPVDPGIAFLRVDDAGGNLMGILSIFGCHAVVLGSNNLLISGDWPGYAMAKVEESLGPNTTCLFMQGGAGDINPLVADVRTRLRSGHAVRAIGGVATYYGAADDPQAWGIGNRQGGTFAEVAELGNAFANEVLYLAKTTETGPGAATLWSEQVTINAAAEPGDYAERPSAILSTELPTIANEGEIPAELMLMGLGDMLLAGQPGEVFSETAVNLRIRLRALGYRTPALVSYANGWLLYLPEAGAFAEGGYEPDWARTLGISPHFQCRAWQAIAPLLEQHAKES